MKKKTKENYEEAKIQVLIEEHHRMPLDHHNLLTAQKDCPLCKPALTKIDNGVTHQTESLQEKAKRLGIETDINKRWENGTEHHKKSEELFDAIEDLDFTIGGDTFCWKSGGDGDNGETLMYELDIYFEVLDKLNKPEEIRKDERKRLLSEWERVNPKEWTDVGHNSEMIKGRNEALSAADTAIRGILK